MLPKPSKHRSALLGRTRPPQSLGTPPMGFPEAVEGYRRAAKHAQLIHNASAKAVGADGQG